MKQRRTLETNQVDATGLKEMEEQAYTTDNGNRIRFYMWKFAGGQEGAWILGIEWSGADPTDRLPDASNTNDRFLWGTVLNSPSPGVVTITNPFLGQTIALDMSDPRRPRHISEHGDVEAAGANEEVWVDFDWKGVDAETGATLLPSVGDFFRPFRSLAEGVAAVADHGVLKIVPGHTSERGALTGGKRLRLSAPIGGVRIGAAGP